jgi:hypothetical protein
LRKFDANLIFLSPRLKNGIMQRRGAGWKPLNVLLVVVFLLVVGTIFINSRHLARRKEFRKPNAPKAGDSKTNPKLSKAAQCLEKYGKDHQGSLVFLQFKASDDLYPCHTFLHYVSVYFTCLLRISPL